MRDKRPTFTDQILAKFKMRRRIRDLDEDSDTSNEERGLRALWSSGSSDDACAERVAIYERVCEWRETQTQPGRHNGRASGERLAVSLTACAQLVGRAYDRHVNAYYCQTTPQTRHYSFQTDNSGMGRGECPESAVSLFMPLKLWLQRHEDYQVMLASILVVLGLWWLVRAAVVVLMNLVVPMLVVLLAVVLVPQLRAPLLGQNYPALADLIHDILVRLAENIKHS